MLFEEFQNYQKNLHNPLDCDIYIPKRDSLKAFNLLKKNGWLEVKNPVANYKNITHFYYLSQTGLFHLHIYIGIRTGDSWLKQYYFPLDDFIKNNITIDQQGINLLNKNARTLFYYLRIFIKNSTFVGRFLYSNTLAKYRNEFENIHQLKGIESLPYEIKKFYESIYVPRDRLFIPNINQAKDKIKYLKKYLIVNENTIFLRQILNFFHRLINKLIFKTSKRLLIKPPIIVFQGSDGCGKSTLVKKHMKFYLN